VFEEEVGLEYELEDDPDVRDGLEYADPELLDGLE